MKRTIVGLVLIGLVMMVASVRAHEETEAAAEEEGPSDVVKLTDETYATAVAGDLPILIKFFAPWCGHCKSMAGAYKAAATLLKDKAIVAEVDATEQHSLAEQFGVRGFPTLFLVMNKGATHIPYNGPREAVDFVRFVEHSAAPSTTEIKSAADLTAFKTTHTLNVIGCFPTENEMFKNVAAETAPTAQHKYGVVSDVSLMTGVECPALVSTVPGLAAPFVMKVADDTTKEQMLSWITIHTRPIMEEIGPTNFRVYVDLALPILWLVCKNGEEQGCKDAQKVFANVASKDSKIYESFSFIWLNDDKYHMQSTSIGLPTEHALPWAVLTKADGRLRYILPDTVSLTDQAAVSQWFQDYLEGKITNNIKSESEPKEPAKEGEVVTVVATNFDRVVKDSSKDVLVKFYATWCGHCQSLAPIYQELAKVMAGVKSVVVAEFNAPENDTPEGVNVQGFPTVILFPAGEKKSVPVTFEGERTVAAMAAFIHEHAGVEFEMPAIAAEPTNEGDDKDEKAEL